MLLLFTLTCCLSSVRTGAFQVRIAASTSARASANRLRPAAPGFAPYRFLDGEFPLVSLAGLLGFLEYPISSGSDGETPASRR